MGLPSFITTAALLTNAGKNQFNSKLMYRLPSATSSILLERNCFGLTASPLKKLTSFFRRVVDLVVLPKRKSSTHLMALIKNSTRTLGQVIFSFLKSQLQQFMRTQRTKSQPCVYAHWSFRQVAGKIFICWPMTD